MRSFRCLGIVLNEWIQLTTAKIAWKLAIKNKNSNAGFFLRKDNCCPRYGAAFGFELHTQMF